MTDGTNKEISSVRWIVIIKSSEIMESKIFNVGNYYTTLYNNCDVHCFDYNVKNNTEIAEK